jgi:hypothetical protein
MVKKSRSAVKTLILNKSRDIVVDRLLKSCEEDDHLCTGWAVLRKEVSPIDANYFLRCTCTCHNNKEQKRIKKTTKKKLKLRKISKKNKRSKKTRRR